MSRGWHCEAYGPDIPGDLCFFANLPDCQTLSECQARMGDERKRAYRRIQELAAHGDPVWAEISAKFAGPDDLLNADEPADPDDAQS